MEHVNYLTVAGWSLRSKVYYLHTQSHTVVILPTSNTNSWLNDLLIGFVHVLSLCLMHAKNL